MAGGASRRWALLWALVVGLPSVAPIGLLLLSAALQKYQEATLPYREHPLQGNKPLLDEYDFIVIGAGSAGTVITNRLTENPEWKVLLLEAGVEDSAVVEFPVIVDEFQLTGYNWGYTMEEEPNVCLSMDNRRCPWPRGKVMGGTSSINYMIYTRGQRRDYDEWAEAGNNGWSYNEVLPYFIKHERSTIPEYIKSPIYGHNGTLSVERVPHQTPLVKAFLEAGKERGYSIIDYNNADENSQGFSRIQANMHQGRRVNGANAFLRPIRKRPNLHIAIKSRVTRVLIDPATMTATAVEMTRNRKWRVIRARKEVILSAGAINSPHILMHSGIGPKDHLAQAGYTALKDLKVGYNLMEHVASAGLTFFVNESVSITLPKLTTPDTFTQYWQGKGLATIPGGVEGIAYVHTKHNDDAYGRPDMEFIFAGASICADAGLTIRKGMGISDEAYYSMFEPNQYCDAFTIWPMILNPKSRGRITIRDNNPFHWPLMHGNYFSDPHDLKVCVEGLKMAVDLVETQAFQRYGATLNPRPVKGCEHTVFRSDEFYECMLRHITTTLHHQSGTCKMGPASDPDAVVDPELRVHGVKRLRVVDASIIPKLPAAHTNAVTYMIAEKAADLIKAAWKWQTPANLPQPSGPVVQWPPISNQNKSPRPPRPPQQQQPPYGQQPPYATQSPPYAPQGPSYAPPAQQQPPYSPQSPPYVPQPPQPPSPPQPPYYPQSPPYVPQAPQAPSQPQLPYEPPTPTQPPYAPPVPSQPQSPYAPPVPPVPSQTQSQWPAAQGVPSKPQWPVAQAPSKPESPYATQPPYAPPVPSQPQSPYAPPVPPAPSQTQSQWPAAQGVPSKPQSQWPDAQGVPSKPQWPVAQAPSNPQSPYAPPVAQAPSQPQSPYAAPMAQAPSQPQSPYPPQPPPYTLQTAAQSSAAFPAYGPTLLQVSQSPLYLPPHTGLVFST